MYVRFNALVPCRRDHNLTQMYWLKPDEAAAERNSGPHAGPPPWSRERFEDGLVDGSIAARHWPEDLPDEVVSDSGSVTPRRHRLQYRWDLTLSVLGVISCNPSGATRRRLDDTLALTVAQAVLWGFGGIDQGNLDPVYEMNSKLMHLTADLADPINRETLEQILENGTVWLAWGNRPSGLKGEAATRWRSAEQHVLAAGHAAQARGTKFVVTRLNKPRPTAAPAHASPRRFPPSAPPVLYQSHTPVRIVESTSSEDV